MSSNRHSLALIGVSLLTLCGVAGAVLVNLTPIEPASASDQGVDSSGLVARSPSVGNRANTTTTTPNTVLSVAPSAPRRDAQPTPQVLTIGDSIMKGFGLPYGQAWPFLVSADNGWALTNVACNGAGVLQIGSSNDCDEDFAGVIDSVSDLHPDIIIFEGSSNDFGLDDSDLLNSSVAELATIRADFPAAQIIGLSTVWGSTDPPDQLAHVSAQVQRAVEQVGGTYLDIGQPMYGHPELMQGDDVHPNTAGQAVLASTIQAALSSVIAVERNDASIAADVEALIHAKRMQ